jgi:hypothetical protein
MTPYRNLSGKSGVVGYRVGPDFIDVEFAGGSRYRYSQASAGDGDVEEMKKLAAAGRGLSAFISREQPAYEFQFD